MQCLKLLYFDGAAPQQICDRYRAGPSRSATATAPARARSHRHAHAAMDGVPAEGGEQAMPRSRDVSINVADLELAEAPGGQPVMLGEIAGVQLLVLLRHRH